MTPAEYTQQLVYQQTQETVKSQAAGIGVRLATVTCPCGRVRSVMLMYRCLYCKVMFCDQCAEEHFGQTVADYRKENPLPEIQNG